jgi:hypothetical protein
MAVDDRISFYGVAIQSSTPRFNGIAIQSSTPRLNGISILSNNFFNGEILVIDSTDNPINNATVTIESTQTNPAYYIGNISGSTDIDGIFIATGSSTTGTTLTVEVDGYNTYTGPLASNGYDNGMSVVLSQGGGSSKKIYTTNKGNILINPNDTILIEL